MTCIIYVRVLGNVRRVPEWYKNDMLSSGGGGM